MFDHNRCKSTRPGLDIIYIAHLYIYTQVIIIRINKIKKEETAQYFCIIMNMNYHN